MSPAFSCLLLFPSNCTSWDRAHAQFGMRWPAGGHEHRMRGGLGLPEKGRVVVCVQCILAHAICLQKSQHSLLLFSLFVLPSSSFLLSVRVFVCLKIRKFSMYGCGVCVCEREKDEFDAFESLLVSVYNTMHASIICRGWSNINPKGVIGEKALTTEYPTHHHWPFMTYTL